MIKCLVAFSDCEEGFFVLNAGYNQKIKPGAIFSVWESQPVKIYDPITKEYLGSIEREKTKLIAREVKPKLTVCTGYIDGMGKEEIGTMQEGLVKIGDVVKFINN